MAKNAAAESHLLATYLTNSPEFETACMTGNLPAILEIVKQIRADNNLNTEGARVLEFNIGAMTRRGISAQRNGRDILTFVYNARLSGAGMGVIK